MFNWLRQKVCNAVLEGINDALRQTQAVPPPEPVPLRLEYRPVEEEGYKRPAGKNGRTRQLAH